MNLKKLAALVLVLFSVSCGDDESRLNGWSNFTLFIPDVLKVNFTDLDVEKGGNVCMSVVSEGADFPEVKEEEAEFAVCIPVEAAALEGVEVEIPDGVYAVAAFHDENSNGEIDKNFFGIPTEKIGFSENPRLIPVPGFDQCKFDVEGNTIISIKLKKIF